MGTHPDFSRGAQEHQKKTLSPTWDEDKWLLVQEPKTQAMRVQMFDHDVLNLKVAASPAAHAFGGPARRSPPTNAWLTDAGPSASVRFGGGAEDRDRHGGSMCHLLQSP